MPDESDNLLRFQYNGANVLSVPAHPEHFPQFESWLDDICDQMKIEQKIRAQLQIAADEIFTNICSYAYPDCPDGSSVSLACEFDSAEKMLKLTFTDRGIMFDPLKQQVVSADVHMPRKGGVGLLMVRNFADSLKYERRDDQNVLTFLKKI